MTTVKCCYLVFIRNSIKFWVLEWSENIRQYQNKQKEYLNRLHDGISGQSKAVIVPLWIFNIWRMSQLSNISSILCGNFYPIDKVFETPLPGPHISIVLAELLAWIKPVVDGVVRPQLELFVRFLLGEPTGPSKPFISSQRRISWLLLEWNAKVKCFPLDNPRILILCPNWRLFGMRHSIGKTRKLELN